MWSGDIFGLTQLKIAFRRMIGIRGFIHDGEAGFPLVFEVYAFLIT